MEQITLQQYARTYSVDRQTPIGLYMDIVGDSPGILLDSAEVDGRLGRYSLIAWDFLVHLSCHNGQLDCRSFSQEFDPLVQYSATDFIPGLRKVIQQINLLPPEGFPLLPPLTRSLIGYLGYGLSAHLEPKLASVIDPKVAETVLFLPGKQILFDHLYQQCVYLSLNSDDQPSEQSNKRSMTLEPPEIGPVTTLIDKEQYCRNVQSTKEMIHQGEAIQVVLSTRFMAPFFGDPFTVYRRLRQTNPSPYMFYLNLPEKIIIGSSPELLVRCRDQNLELRPIAGTRPRGKSLQEENNLAEELLQDEKERAEHVMLVDLGRNDLGRIATPGSVQVEKFMQVEKFSHVMHLTSYLQARLKPELDHLDILKASFPAGTVTGAPKIRAMEIIAQMEPLNRGPYAGAIGWLGLDKETISLDTGITIRSLWIEDNKVFWQAGAGIVSDSDPLSEWQECQNKSMVIKKVLTDHGGNHAVINR